MDRRNAFVGLAAAVALFLARALLAQESQTSPDQVTLKSGDVLRGTITKHADGVLTIVHPDLGPVTLSLERVESFGPVVPKSAEAPTPATGETSAPDQPAPHRKSPWDYYVSFAFAGSFNVNNEFSLRGGAGVKYESESFKAAIDGEYYYRVYNNATSDNNLLVRGLEEWYFSDSPWLFFAQQQYQYDEFQSWLHRISLYGGPGYRLIRTDTIELTLRLGLGTTYEAGNTDQWKPEALIAEDFAWRIGARQKVAFNSSIAPNLAEFGEYRVQGQVEYAFALDETKKGLALTAGLRDIYESNPAPGSKNNDLRVYGGLRYDF